MCLKVLDIQLKNEFGRILYLLGLVHASKQHLIKAEGFLRSANDFYQPRFCYEKVECLILYSQILKGVDIRANEAQQLKDKADELAKQMPYWYPYMVNLMAPDFLSLN